MSAGTETEAAPGLGTRLPAPVRERIAAALRAKKSLEYLGEENVDDSHFNLDPALVMNRWYRTVTPAGDGFSPYGCQRLVRCSELSSKIDRPRRGVTGLVTVVSAFPRPAVIKRSETNSVEDA